jgi:hypothetical protein
MDSKKNRCTRAPVLHGRLDEICSASSSYYLSFFQSSNLPKGKKSKKVDRERREKIIRIRVGNFGMEEA